MCTGFFLQQRAIVLVAAILVGLPISHSAVAAASGRHARTDLNSWGDAASALQACNDAVSRLRAVFASCAVAIDLQQQQQQRQQQQKRLRQQPPCHCYCPKCTPDGWPDVEKLPLCDEDGKPPAAEPSSAAALVQQGRTRVASQKLQRQALAQCLTVEANHRILLATRHCLSERRRAPLALLSLQRQQQPLGPTKECTCYCPPCDANWGPPPKCKPRPTTSKKPCKVGPSTTGPPLDSKPFTEYTHPPIPKLPPVGDEFLPTLAPLPISE